jgi:hypothetical protein
MEIEHGTKKILDLVNMAYRGEVMLPDFQRNFVWERQSIEELIESILENIFIGTFLILNTSSEMNPFKCIFIQGAEEVNPKIEAKPTILILDGQQRLTALFYAIYSPNNLLRFTGRLYSFFIDLQKLSEDNFDEAVFSKPKNEGFYKSLLNGENSFNIQRLKEEKIIPMTYFQDIPVFNETWYEYFRDLFDRDTAQKVKSYLDRIFYYDVITLSLQQYFNVQPDKIVMLFERLNRTGIKLSTYDLLVARFYKFIKLREEWERLFDDNNGYHNIKKLASNNVDKTSVPFSFIQALALSKDKSIKDRDLIKLDSQTLNKQEWDRVVDIAENKVLNKLFERGSYGIGENVGKWLPYSTIIIPYLAFHLKYAHPDMEKINMWYWSVVFSESYSGSTESEIMKDFREVSKWFNDDSAVPEVVKDFREQIQKNGFKLKNVKRVGSSLYKGVFNLLMMNNPLDFFEPENIAYNELNDHHIFPRNFLKDIEAESDIVLNRTLIFDKTNKIISNNSPADYLKEMIEIQMKNKKISYKEAENKVKKILENHFINEEMFEIMRETSKNLPKEKIKQNFEKFIDMREKLIVVKIKTLIGLKE